LLLVVFVRLFFFHIQGITIDKGCQIKSIKEDSVLTGQVYPKETILKVNGLDTSTMTPAALSEYLREHANEQRTLTILKAPKEPQYETIKVIAPKGKLGVIIERTNQTGGPIIKRMNETSPLLNQLMVGDQLIEVDGNDATTMTSSAVAEYLAAHAEAEQRVFVVKRLIPETEEEGTTPMAPMTTVVAPKGPTSSMQELTYMAPAGKLGIVIERSMKQGPIIKTIHDHSPLKGQLVVGDQLKKIDEENVTNMSSTQIADYLVKNATKERKLVIQRLVVEQPIPVEEIEITTTDVPKEEEKVEEKEDDIDVAPATTTTTTDMLVDIQEQQEIQSQPPDVEVGTIPVAGGAVVLADAIPAPGKAVPPIV
jgi:hypothetical protein